MEETGNLAGEGPTEEITEALRKRYTYYYILLPRANAELDLNYYKKVVMIRRMSSFPRPK